MDVNGLWTVSLSTSQGGEGTGVLTVLNGLLRGGDANYYYVGSYEQDGSKLIGSLRIVHYHGPLTNVFGPIRDLDLNFNAVAGSDLIMGQGHAFVPIKTINALQAQHLAIRMQRVAKLDR
jgi:hypothetical protein